VRPRADPAVRLAGAVVVVTGSTRGLGRSTARLLAARGARVVVVGRDAGAARGLATQLGGSSVAVDLREESSAEQVVAHAVQAHGRLDAVVANAGVGHAGDVADMAVPRVHELVELNVLAPLLLARASLPVMRAQGAGGLLFVTSVAGALGVPGESVYSATKAAVEMFADVLREEVKRDGISVSTVLPGVVRTDFFATRGVPYERRFPRPMTPDRAAHVVVRTLEDGRRRRIVPSWLALPARLSAAAPETYRRLERRLG
jgi:short-subunit dehydrogenase